MELQINGRVIEAEANNVYELLALQGIDPAQRGIAVAINDQVIPRAQWSKTFLHAGDVVEILTAMQGG